MILVCYGGGVNSTAMLVGMKNKGIKPDLILFADTGGEKPHTYQHIKVMNEWLKRQDWPQILTVKKVSKTGDVMTLEGLCLEKNMLPSLAYGFKNCSQKFKIAPQDKYSNNYEPFKNWWKTGRKVEKYIGYDTSEPMRVENARSREDEDKKYTYSYPLYDWGWNREDCLTAIADEGLPTPGKSSCYFCPASKLNEIRALNENYPELAVRAIAMEDNAELTSVKGLGRRFAWRDVLSQGDMFNGFDRDWDLPCGCYDGELS